MASTTALAFIATGWLRKLVDTERTLSPGFGVANRGFELGEHQAVHLGAGEGAHTGGAGFCRAVSGHKGTMARAAFIFPAMVLALQLVADVHPKAQAYTAVRAAVFPHIYNTVVVTPDRQLLTEQARLVHVAKRKVFGAGDHMPFLM